MVAKRSARQARVKALTQMRPLVITAPDQLRCRLKGLSVAALVREASRLRASRSGDVVTVAHKASLCSLARRIQGLEDEIAELDPRIEALLVVTAPELLARFGVGPDTAAALLVSAGGQPRTVAFRGRLGSPLRRGSHPGLLRKDHPLPTRPWGRSQRQQRALAHRHGPHRP